MYIFIYNLKSPRGQWVKGICVSTWAIGTEHGSLRHQLKRADIFQIEGHNKSVENISHYHINIINKAFQVTAC